MAIDGRGSIQIIVQESAIRKILRVLHQAPELVAQLSCFIKCVEYDTGKGWKGCNGMSEPRNKLHGESGELHKSTKEGQEVTEIAVKRKEDCIRAINDLLGLEAWEAWQKEKKKRKRIKNEKEWRELLGEMCSLEPKGDWREQAQKEKQMGQSEQFLCNGPSGLESSEYTHHSEEELDDGPPPGFPIAKYRPKETQVRRSPRLAKKTYVCVDKEKKDRVKMNFKGRKEPIGAQLAISLIAQSGAVITEEIEDMFNKVDKVGQELQVDGTEEGKNQLKGKKVTLFEKGSSSHE